MQELHIHLSLDRPTGNFWVDMGLVVLVRRFGEGDHPAEEVRAWLLRQLVQETGNKGEYYDEATDQIREYDKKNWVYPTNLFIKASGKPGKKVKIDGKVYPTQPPVFELQWKPSKNPDVCDLCGEVAPLTDAKMWMYPFVVTPDKFGTFYPGTKRGLKLCVRCVLAGLAGYLGWLWKAQGRDALHFFVFHSELRELERLHREVLEPLRLAGQRGGSAPVAFAGPYVHETTLGLLLELFQHVRESDRLSERARELLARLFGAGSLPSPSASGPPAPVTLYAITGTPGRAFQMSALREFSRLQRLYRLYEHWLELLRSDHENPHRQLVAIWRQFEARQGQDRDTLWRDKIAQAILEFGDPLPFVERFLFEARAREENPRPLVGGTLKTLDHYVQEVLGMDEQLQRTLAGFGYALGAAAQEHNEMGLLYALRNAKNPEEFYRVLNDAQFRLEVTIPEALLRVEKDKRVGGVSWMLVKTLLSIYAMNAYLRRGSGQPGQAETEEVSTTQEAQEE